MGKLFSSYFDWNRGAIPIIHLPKWLTNASKMAHVNNFPRDFCGSGV